MRSVKNLRNVLKAKISIRSLRSKHQESESPVLWQRFFDVPVVFAKKTQTKNIAGDVYTTKVESFTHGRVYDIIVSKEFLGEGDRVLLIDDFLANGKALEGLAKLVKDSGAELVGAGVVIEKGFQPGGDFLRKQTHLESLAIVDAMDEKTGEITFRE